MFSIATTLVSCLLGDFDSPSFRYSFSPMKSVDGWLSSPRVGRRESYLTRGLVAMIFTVEEGTVPGCVPRWKSVTEDFPKIKKNSAVDFLSHRNSFYGGVCPITCEGWTHSPGGYNRPTLTHSPNLYRYKRPCSVGVIVHTTLHSLYPYPQNLPTIATPTFHIPCS